MEPDHPPRHRSWRIAAIALGLVAVAVVAIIVADDDEPKFTGAGGEIASVVERYEGALAARDVATICRELLAPSTLAEWFKTPDRCERKFSSLLERPGFADGPPSGDIARIEIEGDSATAHLERGFYELAKERGHSYIHLIS